MTLEVRGGFTIVLIIVLVLLGLGFLALGAFPPAPPRPNPVMKVIPTSTVGAG